MFSSGRRDDVTIRQARMRIQKHVLILLLLIIVTSVEYTAIPDPALLNLGWGLGLAIKFPIELLFNFLIGDHPSKL